MTIDHIWFMSAMRYDELAKKNVIEVLKVSTGLNKLDGPFYNMHPEYRAFAYHPLVVKSTNCAQLKVNGTRNTKLLVSDPLVRSTYLDGEVLHFKGKKLEAEQIYQDDSRDHSLDAGNLSAKEIAQIYRKYRFKLFENFKFNWFN